MKPTISVLVPTYNRSVLLKKALASILTQNYQDFEVVVVDNNSTDDTEAVISEFNDTRIIFYKNEYNMGALHNHNKALRLCKGEFIHIFSDDDIMFQDSLVLKLEVFKSYPQVGLVHSNITVIDENDVTTSEEHWALGSRAGAKMRGESLMKGKEAFELLYNEWNFISMPSVMVRKSVLDDYKIEFNNQLKYLFDWDLWINIARFSDFYYLQQRTVSYRLHSSNISKEFSSAHYFKELLLIKVGLSDAEKKEDFKSVAERLIRATCEQLAFGDKTNKGETDISLVRQIIKFVPFKNKIKQLIGRK